MEAHVPVHLFGRCFVFPAVLCFGRNLLEHRQARVRLSKYLLADFQDVVLAVSILKRPLLRLLLTGACSGAGWKMGVGAGLNETAGSGGIAPAATVSHAEVWGGVTRSLAQVQTSQDILDILSQILSVPVLQPMLAHNA
eukprot:1855673-Pyramimonas_sp.AAC.2